MARSASGTRSTEIDEGLVRGRTSSPFGEPYSLPLGFTKTLEEIHRIYFAFCQKILIPCLPVSLLGSPALQLNLSQKGFRSTVVSNFWAAKPYRSGLTPQGLTLGSVKL